MARIEIHHDSIIIRLSKAEKLAAFRRSDVELERSRIRQAIITDDPWVWIRGVCSRGTLLPGRKASGVWRHHGGNDFLLARNRKDSIVLDFEPPVEDDGQNIVRIVLSTQHAADIMAALELPAPETPQEFGN